MKVRRTGNDAYAKLSFALNNLKGKVGKAGWVEATRYPEEDGDMTTAEVAMISEFGQPSKNIPPRPIVRPAIVENRKKWSMIARIESQRALSGDQNISGIMEILGLEAAGAIRKNITELTSPPLSKVTIAIRKSKMKNKNITGKLDKPLVFTKLFLNSCTNTVEDE